VPREENLVDAIGHALQKFNFKVDYEFRAKNSFIVDIVARRSGLILLVEVSKDEMLSFDTVGKLVTIASYFYQSYEATTIKKLIITTAKQVPDYVRTVAVTNDVSLIQITDVSEIQTKLGEIQFTRPIERRKLEIGGSVEKELAKRNASNCYALFRDLLNAYESEGKLGVERRVREIIKERKNVSSKQA
jgi:hypothetical protein